MLISRRFRSENNIVMVTRVLLILFVRGRAVKVVHT
jgi:hypothetical protein